VSIININNTISDAFFKGTLLITSNSTEQFL